MHQCRHFCWNLFLISKASVPILLGDMTNSFFLLACCIDFSYANASRFPFISHAALKECDNDVLTFCITRCVPVSVCVCVCVCLCVSVCLSVSVSVCVSAYACVSVCLRMRVCPSAFLSVRCNDTLIPLSPYAALVSRSLR